jgi:hypothetical protein
LLTRDPRYQYLFFCKCDDDCFSSDLFVSIVQMDEAGSTAAAAAMAVMIVATSAAVKVIHSLLTYQLRQKTQAWRVR